MGRLYYVYILTNKRNNVLYIGVTSNLEGRVWQHKNNENCGFTAKYNVNRLVYYEEFEYVEDAIRREKQLKGGSRVKKIKLIESINHEWLDLSEGWY